jgi:YVTN family beta-propeller protein
MSNNKEVEIRVLESPRKEYGERDLLDEPKVKYIIRNRILPQSKEEYYRVDVKIKRKEDKTPQYLLVYMLRKDIYLTEVVKVDVDSNLNEKGIILNYDSSKEEDEEEESPTGKYREYDCGYDFVVGSPLYSEIPSARDAVEKLHELATSVGLRSRTLIDSEATVGNYKNYLKCNLKGFVNIGHGLPDLISLDDGPLSYRWFKDLDNKALKPEIIYFNSCQVHNNPLKAAIMGAGARTFIGGIVNLGIGTSEKVCKCFWSNILKSSIGMIVSLTQCERENYPQKGAHGITGDMGPFPMGLFAYIVNESSNTVSIIDTINNTVIGSVNVGILPNEVAINPTGTKIYVTNGQSETVSVISRYIETVETTVRVGPNPFYIAVNPDGKTIYVTNNGGDSVSLIDTASNTVRNTIHLGINPCGIAVNPAGTKVYVTVDGLLLVIDTATNSVESQVPVGKYPWQVAVSPDGNRVYVANDGSDTVSVIDTATNNVITTVPVGDQPRGIAVTMDGTKVYVGNAGSDSVSIINTSTNTVIATIKVDYPWGIAVSQDGSKLYVTSYASSNCSIIDTTTNTVIATVPVGQDPKGVAVEPNK